MTQEITVTANTGRTFRVRRLVNGSTYGRGVVWTGDRDGVEFFDVTGGTFTGGRYYIDTLLRSENRTLKIDLGVPAWDVDSATMAIVREWLLTA